MSSFEDYNAADVIVNRYFEKYREARKNNAPIAELTRLFDEWQLALEYSNLIHETWRKMWIDYMRASMKCSD